MVGNCSLLFLIICTLNRSLNTETLKRKDVKSHGTKGMSTSAIPQVPKRCWKGLLFITSQPDRQLGYNG